jgi:FMN reductase
VAVICGIDGSPTGGGHSATAIASVLAGAEGLDVDSVSLATDSLEDAVAAIAAADAVVFGTPIHRASYASPLKLLLDHLPRERWGETEAPLRGKAVAIVASGASDHHFLALDDLRGVLAGFFATHVIPPGLYVPHGGFDDEGQLTAPFAEQARLQGRALRELVEALGRSPTLASLEPQI